jgi:hypothetical protein
LGQLNTRFSLQVVLVSSKGTTTPDSALDLMGGGHSLFYKLQSEVFLMASEVASFTIVKPPRPSRLGPPGTVLGAEGIFTIVVF